MSGDSPTHHVTWWDKEWLLVCAGHLANAVVTGENCNERACLTCEHCGEEVIVEFVVTSRF